MGKLNIRSQILLDIRGRQTIIRGIVFCGLVIVASLLSQLVTTLPAHAATGINQQMNYQGRLLNNAGAVVPDGTYNIEFKIYQDGTGCVSSGTPPCSGTLKWTESRIGANKVTVTNGFFSVQLGSVNPFGTNVDWNQDTLWLSVNIGGTGTPAYDGEMTPFRRLTAVPQAINSKQLGGLDWSQFVQVAPAAAQIDSGTLASLFINKTGVSGNILQLQKSGANVFVVANDGSLGIGNVVPSAQIQIDKGNATASAIKFTAGTTTGATATDGFDVGITTAGAGLINQRENLAINFNTSNSQRLSIAGAGDITIGASDTTGSLFILDTKTNTGDPTGLNGGMYYNSNAGKFRCFQASAWADCITVVSTTLQQAYDNSSSPATITTTATAKGIVFRAGSTFDGTVFDVQKASGAKALTVDTANNAVIIGSVASGGNAASAALYFGDTCSNFTSTCMRINEFGGTDSDIMGFHGAGGFRWQTGYGTVLDALSLTTSSGTRFGVGVAGPGAVLHVSGLTGGIDLFRITDATPNAVDVLTIADEGAVTFRNRTDSVNAFRVQNFAGINMLDINTLNSVVGIGANASTTNTLNVGGKSVTASFVDEDTPYNSSVFPGIGVADTVKYYAQSFIADVSTITRFGVWLQEDSNSTVKIAIVPADGGGNPNEATPLYESPFIDPVVTGQWFYQESLNVAVTPGTKYWVLVNGNTGSGTASVGASNTRTSSKDSAVLNENAGADGSWVSVPQNLPMAIHVTGNQITDRSALFNGGVVINDNASIGGSASISERLGVGTSNASEALSVNGNFNIRDNDNPTKQYRFRTSGGALDLEAGGADLVLSTWSGADFTGTQYSQITLDSDGGAINLNRSTDALSGLRGFNTRNPLVGLNSENNYQFVAQHTNATNGNSAGIAFTVTNVGGNMGGSIVFVRTGGNSMGELRFYNKTVATASTNPSLSMTIKDNGDIAIGTSDTTGALLILDTKTTAGDPTGVNGGMYYNSNAGRFRCYENSVWKNCLNGTQSVLQTVSGAASTSIAKSSTTTILTAPFYVSGQMTVNQMRVNVSVALGAAGDVGVYDASGSLVLNGGSSSVSTATGLKTIAPTQTGAARILEPGQYYVAYTWNSTTGGLSGTTVSAVGFVKYAGGIGGGGLVLPSSIILANISTGSNSMPAMTLND